MAEQTPESTETPEPVAFNIADATDEQLLAEYSRVRTAGQELSAQTDADPAELSGLATQLQELSAAITERRTRAEATQTARDAFSAAPELTIPAQVIPAPAVEAPAAEEPVVETPPAQVPSVSQMAAQTQMPVTPQVPEPKGDRISIQLSSDAAGVLGHAPGSDTTVRKIGEASTRLFAQFGTSRVGGGVKASRALATFSRDRGAELTATGDRDHDQTVIAYARSQERLTGGNLMRSWEASVKAGGDGMGALTAAAGWCAPSENRYELCSLWTSDGLLDLPTVSAPRGGINYTNDWSWAQIMDASLTSFTKLTEAQVIADTPKNCTELPCPTFTDRRLDVAVTCITGSFLQDVGYRENVATLIDGLTLKHEREVNEDIISQILTQAGATVVIPAQGAAAPGSTPDSSAVSSILAAVDVAAIDMRYREQMGENQVLEIVLPQWVLAQWRADIGRRNAWHTDPFALANATIMQWFSVRNIRPQFVRGWQDAQSGLATGPGDITAPIVPITALPTTVDFLIYPAGAIVLARQDVITLTNVYDSTNLRQNLYTALFMEEGYAPIFPCGEVRRYTAQACPSGATGHQVWSSCATPAA
ncbi:major capsid protein [Streptomyces sp. NPDC003314]